MKKDKLLNHEFLVVTMATLSVIRMPERFRLPSNYERRSINQDTDIGRLNFSFIQPLETENQNLMHFQIGEYYTITDNRQIPEERGLVEKQFVYPSLFCFDIYYENEGNLIYAIGNNIDGIIQILKRHSGFNDFQIMPLDLDLIERGFRQGLIAITGHSYTSNQGTIKTIRRKMDRIPFNPIQLERGEDIEREYLEVLVGFGDANRIFNVYPSGKISLRGRLEIGDDGYIMLRTAFERLMQIIQNR